MSTAATAPPTDAPPAKGKGKLLVILVAVFALLAIAGGGAAFFFHSKAASQDAAKEGGDEKTAKKEKAEPGKPPVFTTLENFTVNLSGEGEHFLQLGIVLQLKDEKTAEEVKSYLPQIRNRILLLLSAKTAEELQSAAGKTALIDEVLAATREPLHGEAENVQAVLLGSMLIQ